MQHSNTVRAILTDLFGPPPERTFGVRLWDGSEELPPGEAPPPFTLVFRHPGSLRRMLFPPAEIRIAESYIYGDIEVEGDLEAAVSIADAIGERLRSSRVVARTVARLLTLPATDGDRPDGHRSRGLYRLGRRHSRDRDAAAVRFHYDVGNDFYSLWLDPRMVYSCAYFPTGSEDLAAAQTAKLEHTLRKLRLEPGERLLDIGCGWGGLILYAAERFGVEAVGITLSERQAELARQRIAEAGLEGRCRVEIRDYRMLPPEPTYDKIVSVGMIEHVGHGKLPGYFEAAHRALKPGGLFLNHGIVTVSSFRRKGIATRIERRIWRRDVFTQRYVFPDGKLVPLTEVIAGAEDAGFEVRDLESLREHYARTLRHWRRRLESRGDEALRMVGEATYRVWRLYLASAARGFARGATGVVQTLLSKPEPGGRANLPPTRADLYLDEGAGAAGRAA